MGFGSFHNRLASSLVRYLGSVDLWYGNVLSDGDERKGERRGNKTKPEKPTLGGLGVQICIDFFFLCLSLTPTPPL